MGVVLCSMASKDALLSTANDVMQCNPTIVIYFIPVQADLALAEKIERRMMSKVAAAQRERENTEISLLNSGPIARAQVERVAALNARIEELEALLAGRLPVRIAPLSGLDTVEESHAVIIPS